MTVERRSDRAREITDGQSSAANAADERQRGGGVSIPESHLAQEAIAALVDGELPSGPATRAARHLSGCLQCRMAVQAQREAKEALNRSQDVAVPGDLMSKLCA